MAQNTYLQMVYAMLSTPPVFSRGKLRQRKPFFNVAYRVEAPVAAIFTAQMLDHQMGSASLGWTTTRYDCLYPRTKQTCMMLSGTRTWYI
ncbi:hypothetical protein [Aliiroseovarius marinus]|uniref:hypothetical protein n=1 Tax=Aliiroseovarius marinus TaxID=2500159 RepID=UPI003D7C829D